MLSLSNILLPVSQEKKKLYNLLLSLLPLRNGKAAPVTQWLRFTVTHEVKLGGKKLGREDLLRKWNLDLFNWAKKMKEEK